MVSRDIAATAPLLEQRSNEELENELASLASGIAATTARMLSLLAELSRREAWAGQGFLTLAHWLSWRTSMDLGAAREHVRVARALGNLPHIAEAFRRGELSYSKVRAVTRIARGETDQELCAMARDGSAAQIERLVRTYRRANPGENAEANRREARRKLEAYFDEDGMLVIQGRLAAEEGALFMKALEAARESLFGKDPAPPETSPAQRRADALVGMADRSLGGNDRTGGERAMVVVHVDAEVLADPAAEGRSEVEGGPGVSAETSRRLACDGSVVEMRHNGEGETVAGRRRRVLSAGLRRAMLARDGGQCTFPGCGNRMVDGHHCHHWTEGGPTELSNLTALCRRHHVLVHEGGWKVEMTAKGPRFYRPDGRELPAVPSETSWKSPEPIEEEAAGKGANALAPRWEGGPVDYQWAVDWLMSASKDRTSSVE